MPCCTYVSNMFDGNVEGSCHNYNPNECSTVIGYDGESVQTYGLALHNCRGKMPRDPLCQPRSGELTRGNSGGAGASNASSTVNPTILLGMALLAVGVAMRLRRHRHQTAEGEGSAAGASADAGDVVDDAASREGLLKHSTISPHLSEIGAGVGRRGPSPSPGGYGTMTTPPVEGRSSLINASPSGLVFGEYR